MQYIRHYESPLGSILLAADGEGLTGLWFEGQKHFASTLAADHVEMETPILAEACKWLDIYFSGRKPKFTPPLHLQGTEFQMAVWKGLQAIPYGRITTYGTIARHIHRMSIHSQAVGNAVGRNPVSIIVPCHRVVGAGGNLTGYAGGIEKKIALLELEGVETKKLRVPKKGMDL